MTRFVSVCGCTSAGPGVFHWVQFLLATSILLLVPSLSAIGCSIVQWRELEDLVIVQYHCCLHGVRVYGSILLVAA